MSSMEIYHNIVTAESLKLLRQFNRQYRFVLIGGWAVYLFANTLKSKDIDLVIDYDELTKLKENHDVIKNDRLKKYEIKHSSGVDVDIYLPHYSDLGIGAQEIISNVENINGFKVPYLEMLFALKLYAYQARRGSLKGKKDEIDIFSLAFLSNFDWNKYLDLVKKHHFQKYHNEFIALLQRTLEIKELNINQQKMARQRKEILKIIGKTGK